MGPFLRSKQSKNTFLAVSLEARTKNMSCTNAFKTRTYHGGCQSGRRTAGRRGGAGQDGTLTKQFAKETTVPHTLQSFETPVLILFAEALTSEIVI